MARGAWAEPLLHKLRHGQEQKVVRTLEALLDSATGLSEKIQAAVRPPVEYFQRHREHIPYGKVARQGGPIGSGSVESLCSQLQNRFQRTGRFWTPAGLRHLLRLDVLLRNEDFDTLWN